MTTPMTSKITLARIIELLDEFGSPMTTDRGLRAAGLTRRSLNGGPGFVPNAATAILGETVARVLGEPHVGALVGARFEYRALGLYASHVLAAPNLLSAMRRGMQALPYLNPGCSVHMRHEGDHLILSFDPKLSRLTGQRYAEEALPFMLSALVRQYAGDDWLPAWIELPGGQIGADGDLDAIFGTEVRYGAALPGIAVTRSVLKKRNPRPVDASAAIALSDLPQAMGIEPIRSFRDEVRAMMALQLIMGDVSAEAVAQRLGVSVRTLQRQLQLAGTSFRTEKQDFLHERALIFLSQSQATVDETARLLGYDEPNNFRRAFRKWTGMTPLEFAKHRNSGAGEAILG